jgi:hypothetical protein
MTTENSQKIYRKMATDKYFFASYLNMARHNIYLVLNDIAAQLKKSYINDDGRILSAAAITLLDGKSNKDDEVLKAQELLCKKFPFMESLMDEYLFQVNKIENEGKSKIDSVKRKEKADISDYHNLFILLFEQVNNSRNNFTHVYKTVKPFDSLLLQLLKTLYDHSVNEAQRLFSFTTIEIEHIRRRKANPDRSSKQKVIEKPNFRYALEKDGAITDKGLAFFISLFLEKKYAYLMLKQMEHFKDGRSNADRATLETFCAFGMKMPKLRIESTYQENLLYMDMINELKRCPSELYEHLSKENQERFKIKIEAENTSDELEPEALLKRHDDRFTYFMMRYIDEMELFKEARFMMDLGNYNFHVYDKPIDGEMRIRRLNSKLTTFGRFQEFSKEKLYENYGDLVKPSIEIEEDYKGTYIVETYPHYHFDDDNIGIKFRFPNSLLYPDLNNANEKGKPKSEAPDIWMSRHELIPMALHSFLAKRTDAKSRHPTEDILKQHRDRLHRFFKDIVKGEVFENNDNLSETIKKKYDGLDINDIPTELKRYLIDKQPVAFKELAKNKIERMIADSKKRLERLKRDLDKKDRKNQIGRKGHREVKPGTLADFIARDMLALQPILNDGKDKATGLTFQVLQAKIAFYGSTKKELQAMFKECKLIDSEIAHPFLATMRYDDFSGVIAFYEAYLKAKIVYLEKCQNEKHYEKYSWLRLNKAKKRDNADFIKDLTKNYLTMPIFFPRGLFTEPIKQLLLEKSETQSFKNVINNAARVNASFMVEEYYESELNDSPQYFYKEKRSYKLFNQCKDNRGFREKRDTLPNQFFSIREFVEMMPDLEKWIKTKPISNKKGENEQESKRKALRIFEKNEKHIRQEKAKDMVLFLMVKDIMLKSGDATLLKDNIEKLKLSEISPDSEIGILSLQKTFAVKQEYKNQQGQTVSKTIQAQLKYKNYGDFRRFIKDRRMNNLMFYLSAEVIDKKELETELEKYDKARIEIFKIVSEFETVAHPRYKDELTPELTNNGNEEHKAILKLLAAEFPDLEPIREKALNIRNKFSHNQYPEKHLFDGLMPSEHFPIADTFVTLARVYYTAFINKITAKQ